MTISVHSLQEAHSQTQVEEAVKAPKTLQKEAATENPVAKDTVTISQESKQALTHSTTQAGGGDAIDHGNNH
jgi:hypothetical protein